MPIRNRSLQFPVLALALTLLLTAPASSYTFLFHTIDRAKPLELTFIARKDPGGLHSLNTETGGILRQRHAQRFAVVPAGSVVARLENTSLEYELEQSRLLHTQRERELQRATRLRQQGLISSEAFDDIELAYQTERLRRQFLQRQVDKTTVRAQSEFYVTQTFGSIGEYMAPGTPLVEGYDTANFSLSITLPPFYAELFPHMDFFRRKRDGSLSVLEQAGISPVRESSGALRITFPDTFDEVDLNETVRIVGRLHSDYATIPFAAVFLDEGQYAVYTHRDGHIEKVILDDVVIFSDRISFHNQRQLTNYLRSVTGVTRHSEIEDILNHQPDAIEIQVR